MKNKKLRRVASIKSPLNRRKKEELKKFLLLYFNCLNYFIKRLWSEKKFQGKFLDKKYIEKASERFHLTKRLLQCAGKQALQIVKIQRKKSKRKQRIPRIKSLYAELDSRFWKISEVKTTFEWLKIQSGFLFFLPFKRTKVWLELEDRGFSLSNSIRVRFKKNKKGEEEAYIDFIFEKEKPKLKEEGKVLGLDSGFKHLLKGSNEKTYGENMNEFICKFSKREKNTYEQVKRRAFEELKKLNEDLKDVKLLVLERLKDVKKNKRGMFSRDFNRHLSHWLYAKVTRRLEQYCEEKGVRIFYVSPFKTSQYCRFCNNWDRRNRKGSVFKCVHCGHEEDADTNAAKNIELLGLAGVYSLRSLKTSMSYVTHLMCSYV